MDEFSAYELKVLRYIKHHKIRSANVRTEMKGRFLKTTIFLIDKKAVSDSGTFLTLLQQAKDALSQDKELRRGIVVQDFIFGTLTGVASTLLIEAFLFLL